MLIFYFTVNLKKNAKNNENITGIISPFLEIMTDEKWVLFKDKLNFKWPGGGGFTCHQDYPD